MATDSTPLDADVRLDSWKGVAAYLKRDVSTVQRWERSEGLPIRRHQHGKLGSVYAFKHEIDAWWEQRSVRPLSGTRASEENDEPHGDTQIAVPRTRPTSPSLAVLPFANTSRDADEEYFSDGLTSEVINALTHIPGLKVIARTSAFAFKGKSDDIRKIADALGVSYLLEGAVTRLGSRLRVTAHLVHAVDGTQLWAERYDRDLTDVFAVQDEMATAIAAALKMRLPQVDHVTVPPHQPGLPAYEAYLKARHHLPKGPTATDGREATARAVAFFKQAIDLDPEWAEPHVHLAQLYFFFAESGLAPPGPMISFARAEAHQALALSPSDAASHAVLGAIAAMHDFDWSEANRRFRSALLSDSVPPAVHDLYASRYLSPLGQFDAAIDQQGKAITRDPLHMLWRMHQLMIVIHAGLYERAIDEARNALEFVSNSYLAHFAVAQAQFFRGAITEARTAAAEAYRLAPWSAAAGGFLAGILSQIGESDHASSLMVAIPETAPLARIYYHVLRSEIDAALDWYERAVEQRQPMATELASAKFLNNLRLSSRWPKIARMLNLPVTNDD